MVFHRVLDVVFSTWSHTAVLRALQDSAVGVTGREIARLAGMNHRSCLKALSLFSFRVMRQLSFWLPSLPLERTPHHPSSLPNISASFPKEHSAAGLLASFLRFVYIFPSSDGLELEDLLILERVQPLLSFLVICSVALVTNVFP